jgi:hypothetical protein
LEGFQHLPGGGGNLTDRGFEGLLVGARGLSVAAHLADVLQGGFGNLVIGRRSIGQA